MKLLLEDELIEFIRFTLSNFHKQGVGITETLIWAASKRLEDKRQYLDSFDVVQRHGSRIFPVNIMFNIKP